MAPGNLPGEIELESRNFPCLWPTKFSHPKIDSMARRLRKVFESLPHLGYLGPLELKDYAYYENLIVRALLGIDEKATRGELVPIDIRDYPRVLRYPRGVARITAYIGTFDPFQLTHLTIALRQLASPRNRSDLVIVVPEGATNQVKPRKTDYSFRYHLAKAQLENLFEPFILPLDIGANADTIEIVRRLIAMHAGMRLELTHLIGSDVLPIASSFIDEDLTVWRRQAHTSGVDFQHSVHVSRRAVRGPFAPYLSHIRKAGVPAVFERSIVGTPSSTDFRENRAITLVLPTEKIRDKLEIVFRYNMNRPWSAG